MRQFDFYEFTGVIAPGAVSLFGIAILFPELGKRLQGQDFTVGSFGLFVLLAYVAGHLVQALGNAVEWAWWKPWGGMPTDWVRTGKHALLGDAQRAQLGSRLQAMLALQRGEDPFAFGQKAWGGVVRQAYAAVHAAKRSGRVETFNGNYGLNRGIAASLFALAILTVASRGRDAWLPVLLLAMGGCVAVYRMHRFAKHYGRELFAQYLALFGAGSIGKD